MKYTAFCILHMVVLSNTKLTDIGTFVGLSITTYFLNQFVFTGSSINSI